jgi:HSP20 family protein
MTLTRRSLFDLDWPNWMTQWAPFERSDAWMDLLNEAAIRVEEYEFDKKYVIRAELPGIDPDKDVELSVSGGVLRLMVHRQKESRTSDARHYRSEFRYGSFTRLVALPVGASDDDVKATYDDGILEVRIPMNGAQAHERRIAISKH